MSVKHIASGSTFQSVGDMIIVWRIIGLALPHVFNLLSSHNAA